MVRHSSVSAARQLYLNAMGVTPLPHLHRSLSLCPRLWGLGLFTYGLRGRQMLQSPVTLSRLNPNPPTSHLLVIDPPEDLAGLGSRALRHIPILATLPLLLRLLRPPPDLVRVAARDLSANRSSSAAVTVKDVEARRAFDVLGHSHESREFWGACGDDFAASIATQGLTLQFSLEPSLSPAPPLVQPRGCRRNEQQLRYRSAIWRRLVW